ncbi:hypothetical protein L596_000953 [Steinernema carpocapsae]|uniref:Uncharacterized protein n=1 Tax=Steinernema carpocapsae TaxID=34508 RepID=A0A4U8ULY0_STECR|nr:hypothetical protein L596_000953 [Steinernema carpocapsae]
MRLHAMNTHFLSETRKNNGVFRPLSLAPLPFSTFEIESRAFENDVNSYWVQALSTYLIGFPPPIRLRRGRTCVQVGAFNLKIATFYSSVTASTSTGLSQFRKIRKTAN